MITTRNHNPRRCEICVQLAVSYWCVCHPSYREEEYEALDDFARALDRFEKHRP